MIRKGLPVSKVSLRRPGRPLLAGPRPVIKSIIVYTTDQKPRNDYPKRIVSPPFPAACCTDANRADREGSRRAGPELLLQAVPVCGHTVVLLQPAVRSDSPKFRKYYEWKKSVFH
jgi:hypothetical protein